MAYSTSKDSITTITIIIQAHPVTSSWLNEWCIAIPQPKLEVIFNKTKFQVDLTQW